MSNKSDLVRLDTARVEAILKAKDLKLWWLAEMLRVDRGTVSRWMNGKVKWVRQHNIDALAKILECSTHEISLHETMPEYATRHEQSVAATLIADQNLLQVLSSSGKYALAEAVIKASMQPNMPLRLLGDLSIQLAAATWEQGRHDEALIHAQKALEIGEATGSDEILARAHLHLATIFSRQGKFAEALEHFEIVIESSYSDKNPAFRAAVLCNASTNLFKIGQFESAEQHRLKGLELYSQLEKPSPYLSIPYLTQAWSYLERGLPERAVPFIKKGEAAAQQQLYVRGKYFADILYAFVDSFQQIPSAKDRFLTAWHAMESGEMGLHACMGVEIFRRLGLFEEAFEWIQREVAKNSDKYIQAHLIAQGGFAYIEMGKPQSAFPNLEKAIELFSEIGASGRVKIVTRILDEHRKGSPISHQRKEAYSWRDDVHA